MELYKVYYNVYRGLICVCCLDSGGGDGWFCGFGFFTAEIILVNFNTLSHFEIRELITGNNINLLSLGQ